MRVLLVGGRSSIARALRPALESFSETITAGRSGCDFQVDLADSAEKIRIPLGVDTVVHLAADFGGQSFEAILRAEDVNVLGAAKLVNACAEAQVKHLVQVSSIYAKLPESSQWYGIYSLSKRHGEELTRLLCRTFGLPLAIVRPSQIYGDTEMFRQHQPFIYSLLDKAERGEEIVINGTCDALRNFIHVEDLSQVLARVVAQRVEGSFDCVAPSNARFSEIAAAAAAAFGSSSKIRFDPSVADIADNGFEADETLYRRIGYFPAVSLQEGFSRVAAKRRGF